MPAPTVCATSAWKPASTGRCRPSPTRSRRCFRVWESSPTTSPQTRREAICGVSDTLLVKWNHIHLLESREADDIVRYRLLPVFREYALRRLRAEMPQEAEAIQQQYVAHYVRLIQANGNINLPEQYAVLRAEWRNALRAAEFAEQANDYWNALMPLASSLRNFLYLSIYGAEAIQLQEIRATRSVARRRCVGAGGLY